jgi:hypothetical protein
MNKAKLITYAPTTLSTSGLPLGTCALKQPLSKSLNLPLAAFCLDIVCVLRTYTRLPGILNLSHSNGRRTLKPAKPPL